MKKYYTISFIALYIIFYLGIGSVMKNIHLKWKNASKVICKLLILFLCIVFIDAYTTSNYYRIDFKFIVFCASLFALIANLFKKKVK